MKRLLGLLSVLALFILATPVAQANSSILLTEPSHRQINGQFIDDELATSLEITGRLGQLVFNPPAGTHTWVIDPALIEDVTAMSNGYTLTSGSAGTGAVFAKAWLAQLKIDTANQNIATMAYGNPSLYWINQLSPHVANYVLSLSQTRLQTLLNIIVAPATQYHSDARFGMSKSDIALIKADSIDFSQTAAYVDPAMIDTFQLALIKILNPDLTKDRREYLIRDFTSAAYRQIHLVHLSPGRFTVTSSHQDLPITITNGFPTDIKVTLQVVPTNPKVQVGVLDLELVPAHSKIQVMIPIRVLTSGTSGLNVEVISSQGNVLGDPVTYPLKLSVISPIATWVTTGAAILLFIAATIQSIRRIRRRQQ